MFTVDLELCRTIKNRLRVLRLSSPRRPITIKPMRATYARLWSMRSHDAADHVEAARVSSLSCGSCRAAAMHMGARRRSSFDPNLHTSCTTTIQTLSDSYPAIKIDGIKDASSTQPKLKGSAIKDWQG